MQTLNLAGNLIITLTFNDEDLDWMRRAKIEVPAFWTGHPTPPQQGDVLRFGGHQFVIGARAWEHNGSAPILRLYLSERTPEHRPPLRLH